MILTVPCLFGLEAMVADEMKRLQLNNVRAENGRVHCEGAMADIARLNINLRCGARVLMELGSFPARDFESLFQGVLALPWEDFIPRDGEFPVKGYSLNSTLHSVPACQAIVKKAAAKRLGNAYGCETLPETGSPVSDPVCHHQGHRHAVPGHLRRGTVQAGLPGPEHGPPPCGRPWRRRW